MRRVAVRRPRPMYRRLRDPGFMTVRRLNDATFLVNTAAGGANIVGTNVNGLMTLGTPVLGFGYGNLIPFSMQFSLNQIAAVAELADVFEQYRIMGVKVFITYQHNVSTASGTSGMPGIQWYPDFDDNTPPATESEVRQRMGVHSKKWSADRTTVAMYVRPRPIFTAGRATVPYGTWYDCQTNPGEVHYGIKGLFHNVLLSTTERTTTFKIDVQYTIQFRRLQ